jgi:hypothetical protein
MHTGAVLATATPPTCTGFHDFLVDQGRVLLQGVQTFDRLCILNGARVIARGDLTLHVGLLSVAPGSAIVADGAAGYEADTHDCIGNVVHPNGDAGHAVVVVAHHAIIDGLVSANGGAGLSLGLACGGTTPIGRGGTAGSITITAGDLELSGTFTAKGGAGGGATATPEMLEYNQGPSADKSGDGGDGGRIVLTLNQPDASLLTGHLDVSGGAPGAPGTGPAGAQGTNGSIYGIAFDPVHSQHLYVSANDGVFVSRNGGQTWTAGAELSRGGPLILSSSHPGLAYTVGGRVYRTTDGGSTWHVWDGGDLLEEDRVTGLAGYLPQHRRAGGHAAARLRFPLSQ